MVHRVPEECPPAVEALFKSCMQQDPSLRPTAKEVIHTLASIMSIEPAFSTVVDPAPLEDQEVPQRYALSLSNVVVKTTCTTLLCSSLGL